MKIVCMHVYETNDVIYRFACIFDEHVQLVCVNIATAAATTTINKCNNRLISNYKTHAYLFMF